MPPGVGRFETFEEQNEETKVRFRSIVIYIFKYRYPADDPGRSTAALDRLKLRGKAHFREQQDRIVGICAAWASLRLKMSLYPIMKQASTDIYLHLRQLKRRLFRRN